MRIILTASSCDEYYFNLLRVFLTSVKLNSNEYVCVTLINSNEKHVDMIRAINPFVVIDKIFIANYKPWDAVRLRMDIIKSAFDNNIDKVAWMDCDVIVRNSLHDFWKDLDGNVLKILVREKRRGDGTRFQAGIFGLGNSDVTRKYVKDLKESLEGESEWYDDQTNLFKFYKENKDKIKLINAGHKYNDSEFKDKSIVWHCKQSHFEESKFQGEFKRYLDYADRCYNANV